MLDAETIKKIEQSISSSLKRGSVFSYEKDLKIMPHGNVNEVKDTIVQMMAANNKILLSDYFLLWCVNSLGYATLTMILQKLAYEKRKNPKFAFPVFDFRALDKTVRGMVKIGLLYSFSYDIKNKTIVYYTCTQLGWQLAKTRLMQNIGYDKLMLYRSPSDIMKRLHNNSIVMGFASNEACESIAFNAIIGDSKKNTVALGHVVMNEINGTKTHYIIEPIQFNVEANVITEEQNKESINTRLEHLESAIQYMVENGSEQIHLVLVVADYENFYKLVMLLKTRDMDFYLKYACFTSDIVINENGGLLNNCFIKITFDGEKYRPHLEQNVPLQAEM